MDEEWFAIVAESGKLLGWISPQTSQPSLRMFGCGCPRLVEVQLPKEVQDCVKYDEKRCDGLLRPIEVGRRVVRRVRRLEAERCPLPFIGASL